ncbi:MAG: methyltransferase domain-containing protein [Candidatus Sifarchaeia archaeon]
MIFLHSITATSILDGLKHEVRSLDISADLGISRTKIDLTDPIWNVEKMQKIANDPDSIYFIREGEIYKAALGTDHFYKLHPTGPDTAPALLIDGVLMHRVKDINPITDASMKANLCARPGKDILEICTGLGYSTIACLKKGVRSITTIEIDPSVIELAKLNPWSKQLFTDERVSIILGDAAYKIQEFDTDSFHGVLLDPPRFSMGPELYTSGFYSQIHRVLKPNGMLYHYVGSPGSKHRKIDLQKGIITRLRDVGFQQVRRDSKSFGIVAKKK